MTGKTIVINMVITLITIVFFCYSYVITGWSGCNYGNNYDNGYKYGTFTSTIWAITMGILSHLLAILHPKKYLIWSFWFHPSDGDPILPRGALMNWCNHQSDDLQGETSLHSCWNRSNLFTFESRVSEGQPKKPETSPCFSSESPTGVGFAKYKAMTQVARGSFGMPSVAGSPTTPRNTTEADGLKGEGWHLVISAMISMGINWGIAWDIDMYWLIVMNEVDIFGVSLNI